MQQSRLVTLIRTLDRYEIARLRKFVCSPFFNENELLVLLLDELKTNYWRTTENIENNKEKIWSVINNKKMYNDLKFRRLCSDLLQLSEQFLIQIQADDEGYSDLLLLRQLNHRKLNKHFDNTEQQLRRNISEIKLHDYAYYYKNFELEEIVFQYRNNTVRSTRQTNLEILDKQLTISFLVQKLSKYCTALNYKSVSQIDVNIAGINEILHLATIPEYADVPSIAAWLSVLRFLDDNNEISHYHNAVQTLNKHADFLNANERNDLYAQVINYCIRKINASNSEFYGELFNLYRTLLDKRYLFTDSILNYWDYKNIVTLGLRLLEYQWTEDFIHSHKEFLANNWRENAFTYNLAKLRFAQKNYAAVIKLLQTVDYQDIFYTLDSKVTLLKTYFLLDEYDTLHSLLESFRILLLRNKQAPTNTRNSFMNFARYLKKISNINKLDRKSVEKLRTTIEKTTEIVDKQWLLLQL